MSLIFILNILKNKVLQFKYIKRVLDNEKLEFRLNKQPKLKSEFGFE